MYYEFKIDLIVWKLQKCKQSITKGEQFKIDLIVWKFTTISAIIVAITSLKQT